MDDEIYHVPKPEQILLGMIAKSKVGSRDDHRLNIAYRFPLTKKDRNVLVGVIDANTEE